MCFYLVGAWRHKDQKFENAAKLEYFQSRANVARAIGAIAALSILILVLPLAIISYQWTYNAQMVVYGYRNETLPTSDHRLIRSSVLLVRENKSDPAPMACSIVLDQLLCEDDLMERFPRIDRLFTVFYQKNRQSRGKCQLAPSVTPSAAEEKIEHHPGQALAFSVISSLIAVLCLVVVIFVADSLMCALMCVDAKLAHSSGARKL